MSPSSSRSLAPVWATLGMHPTYMERMEAVHAHITSVGPLSAPERIYVAMMVRENDLG